MANIELSRFRIALCHPDDLFSLAECARYVWVRYYPPIIGMPQVLYMLNRMYRIEELLRRMEVGHVFIKVVSPEDCFSGFAELEVSDSEVAFLHKFYIRLELRGTDLAEQLMKAVENESLSRGARFLQLNVNRNNIPAIRFYKKQGFRISYELDVDIGGGFFMNDFRMEKQLLRPGF